MTEAERRIAALSPAQREALMKRMRERGDPGGMAAPAQPELPRIPMGVDRTAPVPLTDVQQAFWIGGSGLFDLGGCSANVYLEYEWPGAVWIVQDGLNAALRRVVDRHEMLRTVVLPDGRQRLLPETPSYEIRVESLIRRTDEEVERHLEEVRESLRYTRNRSDRWPLFDLVLHQLKGGRLRLHARFDAMLIDGTARMVLLEELVRYLVDPNGLPPLEVSYLDHARALADFRSTATYARSRDYWMERLPSLPPAPRLPLVHDIGPGTVPRIVKRHLRLLDTAEWRALKRRTAKAGLTPTGLLTAAYAEALRPWSENSSFTLGMGGSYRPPIHPQIDQVLGTFTTLHLLAVEDGPGSFEQRARHLQERLASDLDHQHFSGHQVLRELNRRHRAGGQMTLPIHFNSVVEYGEGSSDEAPAEGAEETAPGSPLTEIDVMIALPQVLLPAIVIEDGDGSLALISQAVEEVFPEGLVTDLFEDYRVLLTHLATDEASWAEPRPIAGEGGGALSRASARGRDGEGSSVPRREKDPSPTLPRFAGEGAPAQEPTWGALEEELAAIWEEVLGKRPEPNGSCDFFDLGGHSLAAVLLLHRVRERFAGTPSDLSGFFLEPTVHHLAGILRSAAEEID